MGVRFGIQLPDWYARKLLLWAKIKGVTRAGLAANIIQARIEANETFIQTSITEIAQIRGITPEDLIKEWLNAGEAE